MVRILGIDPGSRCTGYGIIEQQGQKLFWIAHGKIVTEGHELSSRLLQIHEQLKSVIGCYQPQDSAIEEVFMYRNAQSALKLGQARGAAIVATVSQGIPTTEYSARQIKQAVVGYGAATKDQVQNMIKMLLGLKKIPESDSADALAIAICHSHCQTVFKKMQQFSKNI